MVDNIPVFFFDLDNCLYGKSHRIHDLMGEKIDAYFINELKDVTTEEASQLHERYYKDYGLALEGLVRHHQVDPMDYNAKVDDALPLEQILKRDDHLRALLLRMDTRKVRRWILTNAYVTHAKRVLKILGVEDLFEGITFCDYNQQTLICKPQPKMFQKAMDEANIQDRTKCFLVDDSQLNVIGAAGFGWGRIIHLIEPQDPVPAKTSGIEQIRSLDELPALFPEYFVTC
ncbi:unnamed protein product [Didymodactylos carnosus]|uniref:Pyrimidine 5-nucleotidase n=1 Tax=Didymodactylos carnosus TaxID=1234261 RepID=A0A815WXK8_9BILA|nr:unnamed protein product [Didymodactylos carnosus]CAF1553468.1 unnamed protein product [Didymodactylos carnosus]CAF4153974.1 unnamed protein product [Didymodactylos carnosus]CAF4414615.1 unnamed protein product [Didymodactylos carnosus]